MKVGHFGPTFIFPVKTGNFFWVKRVAPSSTLKIRKSQKKLARNYELIPNCKVDKNELLENKADRRRGAAAGLAV